MPFSCPSSHAEPIKSCTWVKKRWQNLVKHIAASSNRPGLWFLLYKQEHWLPIVLDWIRNIRENLGIKTDCFENAQLLARELVNMNTSNQSNKPNVFKVPFAVRHCVRRRTSCVPLKITRAWAQWCQDDMKRILIKRNSNKCFQTRNYII